MSVKVKTKKEANGNIPVANQSLKIPRITGAPSRSPNIIIRAVKIMLMDIRIRLRPKQTKEEMEKYSQFSDLAYGGR